MALVKFFKGTEAQYTAKKATFDVDGTIFICTDKPYLYAWGQQIGVDESDLFTVEGSGAITVSGDDEKVIALKIAATNKVLSQSTDGLTTTLKFIDDSEGKKIKLVGIDDVEVASFDYAKFIVDGMLDDAEINEQDELVLTMNTAAGSKELKVNLAKYIDIYTAGNGINITEKAISVKVKDNDPYLEVTENGVASKGIDAAIDAKVLVETNRAKGVEESLSGKIEALEGKVGDESVENAIESALDELDMTEVGGTGKYVKTIKQENGKVTATAEDLTATNVTATAITGGTATNVQGILNELATMWEWHEA